VNAGLRTTLTVCDYDLAATLDSGQAFRWQFGDGAWQGVIGDRWVGLRQRSGSGPIEAEVARPVPDWYWLERYLQTGANLADVLASFPDDPPMRAAVKACRGLRLLRQDPWECLASFLCSSTKQIVQIRQIIALLAERFGEPLAVPAGTPPAFAFPLARRIAALTEADLRACKLGFRAPHLLAAARRVEEGQLNLDQLATLNTEFARNEVMRLPGVGPKIADCVLLFAYGRQDAFPRDVWINRALRELYFPRRRPTPNRVREFAATHFGPWAGFAQQYLFHYIRVHLRGPIGQSRRQHDAIR
jgi:N-glycosylase/DNA lyase